MPPCRPPPPPPAAVVLLLLLLLVVQLLLLELLQRVARAEAVVFDAVLGELDVSFDATFTRYRL